MEVKSKQGSYTVDKLVAENGSYRLYLCLQNETNRQCLFQITITKGDNGKLERYAFFLDVLKKRSDAIEEEYTAVKTDAKDMLNYHFGFPELVESFIFTKQGNRRVNILAFRNVDDLSDVKPLVYLTKKDQVRVDLKSSAWMMGKLLKILTFAHSEGISVENVSAPNIMIVPDQHYILIFDWSAAQQHSGVISRDVRKRDISQAAKAVITVLGGNIETETFPDDETDEGYEAREVYTNHLLQIAKGGLSDAHKTHANFYKLIRSLWERKFHPFTIKPLD